MQTLSVENLPTGVTVADLTSLFRPFGWVAHVDLKSDRGVVDLAWGGQLAARDLNGFTYRGRVLTVRPASGNLDPEPTSSRTLAGDF